MQKVEDLLKIISRADFEEIESVRNLVEFQHLGGLASAYPSLKSWVQKAALINLVQDHLDPRFRPIMLDFLRAPKFGDDVASLEEDVIPLTKSIALCHLDENFDDFKTYYNDERLINQRIAEILHKDPIEIAKLDSKKTNKLKGFELLKIVSTIAIMIGLAGLLISTINQNVLKVYRQHGITTKATVTDKSTVDNELCVGLSYFDQNLLEGGDLILTEVCEFISNELWESLSAESRIDIVFLPDDPENNTILAASLENERLNPTFQHPIWLSILGIGVITLLILTLITRKI